MSEYFDGRIADSQFDASCQILDQIVELRIIEKIRRRGGDGRQPIAKDVFQGSATPGVRASVQLVERSPAASHSHDPPSR